MKMNTYFILLVSTIFSQICHIANSIGVNYGMVADNLPPPAQVAQFLKDKTTIDRVKLFDANPEVIKAFADTNIGVSITMPNGDVAKMTSQLQAKDWVDIYVKPYHPKTKIVYVLLGNEVLHWGPQASIDMLTRAHKYINQAIVMSGIYDIKVSTPHSLGILLSSEPPSQASFRPGWDVGILAPLLNFYEQTKAPFMINPYPYFGFTSLDMALFKPNPGYVDKVSGKTYTCTFDMLMDSVYSSMKKLGYPNIEIVVAETGWPSLGEPFLTHVNVANAAVYNNGLIKKVTSGVGTPLMPGKNFETYIFSLFNENQKPGALAEKNFGLFKPDFTPVYDIGIMKGGPAVVAQAQPQPQQPAQPKPQQPAQPKPQQPGQLQPQQPAQPKPQQPGQPQPQQPGQPKPQQPGHPQPQQPAQPKPQQPAQPKPQQPGQPQPQQPAQPQPQQGRPQTQAKPAAKKWCTAKAGVADKLLQENIDWICAKGMNCTPTLQGGPCFQPNTVRDHASYLMNTYFRATGGEDPANCDFKGTGVVVNADPSKGGCKYE